MELKRKAYLLLAFAAVWAAMQPVLLSFGRGPAMNTFFLLVYASSIPAALLFVVGRRKTAELRNALRDWRKLAILLIIGVVLFLPTEYGVTLAENYVSASLTAVMLRTSPLLMLVLLPTMLRERLTKYQIAALSLGFVGIVIGITGGNISVLHNSNTNIVAFLALMAFVYSFSIVLMKRYLFDISVVMSVAGIAMLLLVLGVTAAEGMHLQPLSLTQISIAIFMGIFYNVINYSLFYYSARQIKTTLSANVLSFTPFLTFVFGGVILAQPVYPYYVVIALLAVVGIAIQSFDKVGGSYRAHSDRNMRHMPIFDVTGIFADTGEMGINTAISNGGRVLAVRLGGEHAMHIDAMALEGKTDGVYTDSHQDIQKESRFVKDVVDAQENDFVVMKAGKLEDGERFFEDLYSRIKSAD